ncbi:hypothetical protein E2C01_082439 [Portunus trituberculatus]|uniref:Uncharacterized protein n=1 Tax=Portunus trituberculatus TaxID=210409 RepID=A0A5B7IZ94_PORTR|nr:hypothetical protein [Portunus trituberculatus]
MPNILLRIEKNGDILYSMSTLNIYEETRVEDSFYGINFQARDEVNHT